MFVRGNRVLLLGVDKFVWTRWRCFYLAAIMGDKVPFVGVVFAIRPERS